MEAGFQGGRGFAVEIQELLGEDSELDTLFLEESWTVGVEGAVESWRRRRQTRAKGERGREFREMGSLGAVFVSAGDWFAGWSQLAGDFAAAPANSAAAQLAETREWEGVAQRWEVEGEEFEGGSEMIDGVGHEGAYRVLGVGEASTREQIKVAYRRMVGRWHPDRFERGTEEARRVATERMVAINEAYRVLCGVAMQECA